MTSRIEEALVGSIYSLDSEGAKAVMAAIGEIEERVALLRATGKLTDATLRRYYGSTRFEQVAESNAIEGSTLSVGETELAVLKGVTLTGHDPGYVRDAIALDRALSRLTEMARDASPTNIEQLKELHELILEGRPSAGNFRSKPVRISGSEHRPPKTWEAVMTAMEDWEKWSVSQAHLPAPLRASVLHAWMAHIHPFEDGNGRSARAVSNLELVRVGYPPVIIRKTQDRNRYIDALQASDQGGDIGPFIDLMIERINVALGGLESAAREVEGFDPVAVRLRQAQSRTLAVWNRSVELLYEVLVDKLVSLIEQAGGVLSSGMFSDTLALDDYISLCRGQAVARSWAFRVRVSVPGLGETERLAWVGYRSSQLQNAAGQAGTYTPSLFWSKRNPSSYPPWIRAEADAPELRELSITPSEGDEWHALRKDGTYVRLSTVQAARTVANAFVELVS